MIIFKLLEVVLIIVILYGIYTQLLQPAISNRKLFPFFRKEGKIESEVVDINQQMHEKELTEELQAKKDQLNNVTLIKKGKK